MSVHSIVQQSQGESIFPGRPTTVEKEMRLIHEYAPDECVEPVLGPGLLAAVVGVGVVDDSGLWVTHLHPRAQTL